MKRFHSSLDSLLRIREREEEIEKRRMQLAQRKCQMEEGILHELEAEVQKVEGSFRGQRPSSSQYLEYSLYLEKMRERIFHQKDRILKEQNQLTKERERWKEKRKEKKVVQKLREKQYVLWKREKEKREQDMLDDLFREKKERI